MSKEKLYDLIDKYWVLLFIPLLLLAWGMSWIFGLITN